MPARSKEERERRRKEFEERKAARRLAKESSSKDGIKSAAATDADNNSTPNRDHACSHANARKSDSSSSSVDLSKLPPEEANASSKLCCLSKDALHQVFSYLPSRELGATTMTCRVLNYALAEGRVQHLLSRLNRGGDLPLSMCRDEAEARDLLEKSLVPGDNGGTGRLATKKSKRKGADRGADEYISYARFIESSLSGCEIQDFGGREAPALPAIVNGRLVSVSPEHSLCRKGGGGDKSGAGGSGVASWGVGKRGQLGHGKRDDQSEPTPLMQGIGYGVRIVQVSAGGGLVRVAHSLLLTSTGRVLSFGMAHYGQLGHGISKGNQLPDVFRPQYIEALSRVRCQCVSAGELHSAVVTTDGDVYTFGDGFCGQLGLGDKRPQMLPQQVTLGGLEDECVSSVSCGARHTLCVTDDGECYSWGLGYFGVLGRSYTPFKYDADAAIRGMVEDLPDEELAVASAAEFEAATAVSEATEEQVSNHTISEETRAHLDLLGNLTLDDPSNQCYPLLIDSLQEVRIVGASAGHRHSMLLDHRGDLYTFGSGTAGALGHGDLLRQEYPLKVQEFSQNNVKVINMSAGVDISMAVSSTGDVYSWGKTDGGRIGLGAVNTSVTIPRKVGLPGDGKKVNAIDVECGYVHSLIVGLDGSVYQCGGVGIEGAEDGQNDEFDSKDTRAGRPVKLKELNIWHRCAEPKMKTSSAQRWKKYGSYEVKGRSNMMSETEKWGS
mmetsp:Transcript_25517/g.55214  ORF Transcript_25517/g.55214 Transcript_25517/m.55214 type:complete len:724 (+) Transcript_25517:401-2572(+)